MVSEIEEGDMEAYTSTLTWDEVSYEVEKALGWADALEVGKKFINFPRLRFISVDEGIIREARFSVRNTV